MFGRAEPCGPDKICRKAQRVNEFREGPLDGPDNKYRPGSKGQD